MKAILSTFMFLIYIFNDKGRNLSQFWCFGSEKHQNCDKFRTLPLKIYIKDIKVDKMAFVLFRQWSDLHYVEFSSKSIESIFFYLNFKISNRWEILKKKFFLKKNFLKNFFEILFNIKYSSCILCDYIIYIYHIGNSSLISNFIFDRYIIFKFKLWPLESKFQNFVR